MSRDEEIEMLKELILKINLLPCTGAKVHKKNNLLSVAHAVLMRKDAKEENIRVVILRCQNYILMQLHEKYYKSLKLN